MLNPEDRVPKWRLWDALMNIVIGTFLFLAIAGVLAFWWPGLCFFAVALGYADSCRPPGPPF